MNKEQPKEQPKEQLSVINMYDEIILEFFSDASKYLMGSLFVLYTYIYDKPQDMYHTNTIANISVMFDYRSIRVSVFAVFFTLNPEEQLEALIHEAMHLLTLPLEACSTNLLDGKLVTKREIIHTSESLTECLSQFITRIRDHKDEDKFMITCDKCLKSLRELKKKWKVDVT